MPRYWRDPDTLDVIKDDPEAPADPGDVVVVPLADWVILRGYLTCETEWNPGEIQDILAGVEEDSNVR